MSRHSTAGGVRAPCTHSRCKMLADTIRDEEPGILRPSVGALGLPDLVLAQRLAVNVRGVLLVWRSIADVTVEDDERRAAFGPLKGQQGKLDAIDIVGIADA